MHIAVIGTGYVGLVTGTCLAESGNQVIGMDNDQDKIDKLHSGKLPIYEPGLHELFERNCQEGRLRFTTDLAQAVAAAEIVFISVGTPPLPSGDPNLSYVWEVADQLAGAIKSPGKIIVIKSTVPVGTNRQFGEKLAGKCSVPFQMASNPEFLKEGAAVDDFMKPDRVVVGTRSDEVADVLEELYRPFLRTGQPFLRMTPESAEMTKYAANAMLASRISFMNEIANLCEKLGADIDQVRIGISHDERIGRHFLFPGAGYGGSCFPKDVRAVLYMARGVGQPMQLVAAIDQVNEQQKHVLFAKIKKHYGDALAGKTLAVWGLAFKPRTDDTREAPALTLIDDLLPCGVKPRVYDPEAMANVRKQYGDKLIYCKTPFEALQGADALVIVTEWPEFRHPDFDQMRKLLRSPVIFDGRNLYEPAAMAERGFTYYSIGRK
jgi:UDPglucose 6-dehydrogenase